MRVRRFGLWKCVKLADALGDARCFAFQIGDHRLGVALFKLEREFQCLREPAQPVCRKLAGGTRQRMGMPARGIGVLGGQRGAQILTSLAQSGAKANGLLAD